MTTYIKFYADGNGHTNKLFTWRLKQPENIGKCLAYFYCNGLRFRAAWLCKGIISVPIQIPDHMKPISQKQKVHIKKVHIKNEVWKRMFSITRALNEPNYLKNWQQQ